MNTQDTFQTVWDRTVFVGSIVGLCFLLVITMFRYHYLIPRQENVVIQNQLVQDLREEIRELKLENERLRHEN